MPIYEYQCPEHGKFSNWARIDDRHTPTPCNQCGVLAPFVISAPRVFGDFEPYISPASGNLISGKRQRQEDFARTGTRPYESGEREAAIESRKREEKRQDAVIDNAIEQTIAEICK